MVPYWAPWLHSVGLVYIEKHNFVFNSRIFRLWGALQLCVVEYLIATIVYQSILFVNMCLHKETII